MNVNLSELIAALPEDTTAESTPEWARERLNQILADLAMRPVPTGSMHRLWTVSELSAQIALAYFSHWIRGWFANAEARQQRTVETNLRLALKTFHRLGYLRGAMTKLGQAAGSLPEILPAQIVDTLDRLHFEAPPMHYSLIREMVSQELGAPPEEIFASFEKEAFAAASIGQVHRARLKSGERVAVKIQYPGIGRTIDADFRNLSALLAPMRLSKDWESTKGSFDEVHRMLRQEVDYRQEAESQRIARSLFREEDGVVVPRVYADYSTTRVLTTDYLEGRHLDALLATNPPQRLRNQYGTRMYAAWFRMYFSYIAYADPHSGNYLFLDDGRLGLIDFGCVQRFDAEQRDLVRIADRYGEMPPEEFADSISRACMIAKDDPLFPEYLKLAEVSLAWMLEPLKEPGAFDFGDEGHLKRGVEWFTGAIRKRTTRSNPMYVYFNRSVFGLKAVLLRLRAQVDVHQVMDRERELWDERGH